MVHTPLEIAVLYKSSRFTPVPPEDIHPSLASIFIRRYYDFFSLDHV